MESERKTFERDNLTNYYKIWMPKTEVTPVAVIQIIHGMAESIKRYDEFAVLMSEKGFIVVGQDLRGHGETAHRNSLPYGFFRKKDGWKAVLDDIHELNGILRLEYSELPLFILGHSMGSFLLRNYLVNWPEESLSGAIITGTGHAAPVQNFAIRKIAENTIKKNGPEYPAKLIRKMTFDDYNKHFKPNRTSADWISRDNAVVDKAEADPEFGFTCTGGLYLDVTEGLKNISDRNNLLKMNKNLPVLFYSGNNDPVGNFGKGVLKVVGLFKKAGMENIQLNWCSGGRHEILNEINREKVFREIFEWILNLL